MRDAALLNGHVDALASFDMARGAISDRSPERERMSTRGDSGDPSRIAAGRGSIRPTFAKVRAALLQIARRPTPRSSPALRDRRIRAGEDATTIRCGRVELLGVRRADLRRVVCDDRVAGLRVSCRLRRRARRVDLVVGRGELVSSSVAAAPATTSCLAESPRRADRRNDPLAGRAVTGQAAPSSRRFGVTSDGLPAVQPVRRAS